jgi:hypothetical protein
MKTRLVPLLGLFLFLFGSGPARADDKTLKEKNNAGRFSPSDW